MAPKTQTNEGETITAESQDTATESTATTSAPAQAAEGDNRYVMITDPETNNGQPMKRADWIRTKFQEAGGKFYGDRGALAKRLTDLQGKKVPYQIVFAATKDLKHIRKPVATEAQAASSSGEGVVGEGAAA